MNGVAILGMVPITEFFDPSKLENQFLLERAQRAKKPRSRQFVAYETGTEAAYLSLDFRSDINTGVLYEIFVLPQYRNRGHGTALVSYAEGIARTMGCQRMRLWPRAFDASVDENWLGAWYSKQGYSPVGDGTSELQKFLGPNAAGTPNAS